MFKFLTSFLIKKFNNLIKKKSEEFMTKTENFKHLRKSLKKESEVSDIEEIIRLPEFGDSKKAYSKEKESHSRDNGRRKSRKFEREQIQPSAKNESMMYELFFQYINFVIGLSTLIALINFYWIFQAYSQQPKQDFTNLSLKNLIEYFKQLLSPLINAQTQITLRKSTSNFKYLESIILLLILSIQVLYYQRKKKLKKRNKIKNISNFSLLIKGFSKKYNLKKKDNKNKILKKLVKKIEKRIKYECVKDESFVCNIDTGMKFIKYLVMKFDKKLVKVENALESMEEKIDIEKERLESLKDKCEADEKEEKNIELQFTQLKKDSEDFGKKKLALETDLIQNNNNSAKNRQNILKSLEYIESQLDTLNTTDLLLLDLKKNINTQNTINIKKIKNLENLIELKKNDFKKTIKKKEEIKETIFSLLKKLDFKYKLCEHHPNNKNIFYAFLTFESQEDRDRILHLYKIFNSIEFMSFLGLCKNGEPKFDQIEVMKAPEPSQVNWTDVAMPSDLKKRHKLQSSLSLIAFNFLIFMLQSLVIIVTFLVPSSLDIQHILQIIFCLASIIAGIKLKKLDWFYFLAGSLFELLNELVTKFYNTLTTQESHFRRNSEKRSFAHKIIIGRFFLSEVTTFALFIFPLIFDSVRKIGDVDDLSHYIFTMLVLNLTTAPVFSYLKMDIALHNMRMLGRRKKMKKPEKFFLNKEKELNKVFNDDENTIGFKYCDILKELIVSIFYSWILPSGVVICLLTLVVQFWVDKKNMKKLKKEEQRKYQNKICRVTLEYFKYIPLAYSTGNVFFSWLFLQYIPIATIFTLVLTCIIYFFYPIQQISNWISYGDHKFDWFKDPKFRYIKEKVLLWKYSPKWLRKKNK